MLLSSPATNTRLVIASHLESGEVDSKTVMGVALEVALGITGVKVICGVTSGVLVFDSEFVGVAAIGGLGEAQPIIEIIENPIIIQMLSHFLLFRTMFTMLFF